MLEVSTAKAQQQAVGSGLTGAILSALSAVVDLYLAVYPAVVLAKLQLNIKKKLALSGALGIGSMCVPPPLEPKQSANNGGPVPLL